MSPKKPLPIPSPRFPSVTQLKQCEMYRVASISWNRGKGVVRSRCTHGSCDVFHDPHNWGVEREDEIIEQVMTSEKFSKPVAIQDI